MDAVASTYTPQDTKRRQLSRTANRPGWDTDGRHGDAYRRDPVRYALGAVSGEAMPGRLMVTLYQLLRGSRSGMETSTRRLMDRVVRYLMTVLAPEEVLTVLLAVRRVRANHKHTSRAVAGFVFNHPQAPVLALRRRPAMVDCLEHALGRNTVRGGVNALVTEGASSKTARRLLKFASDADRAEIMLRYLYRLSDEAMLRQLARAQHELTAGPQREAIENDTTTEADAEAMRPKTVTTTNRGEIAAALVHLYRGGPNAELQAAVADYARTAAEKMPRFGGDVAMVLDASASTRGYGDREYACISQSVAFKMVVERCVRHFTVIPVGGEDDLHRPSGATDLASALLRALEVAPDVVAVVSDGYENTFGGDLDAMVKALPGAGVDTPVVFCHSQFTDKDDLLLRRPVEGICELAFWHQADFGRVMTELFSRAGGGKGRAFFVDCREKRLREWEAANLHDVG